MIDNLQMSDVVAFRDVDWAKVPAEPGVYVIYDDGEVIYVGMSGRNGKGNLRNRLRDHRSGQMVNMFAQYLFLARVQFIPEERITHPHDAKAACHKYIVDRCSFRYCVTDDGREARELENKLKAELRPALNP
jgi:excinuclease UvrABC nuclease subunit